MTGIELQLISDIKMHFIEEGIRGGTYITLLKGVVNQIINTR